MICGNDPTVELTPGDRAAVDWFREWLAWNKRSIGERGPEPVMPEGFRYLALVDEIER